MNAYVAGGIANGLGGAGLGIAAFNDAKFKEQKYQHSMEQYDSKMRDIRGTSGELMYYYDSIIKMINSNSITRADWEKECRNIAYSAELEELHVKSSTLLKIAAVIAIIFLIVISALNSNSFKETLLLCVFNINAGMVAFFVSFVIEMIGIKIFGSCLGLTVKIK